MRVRRLGLSLAVLALAACEEPVTPDEVPLTGTFVVESVAGKGLPALLLETPLESGETLQLYLTSDTLIVEDNGTYMQHAFIEGRVDGDMVSRSRWSDRGVYVRTGRQSAFESSLIENVEFIGNQDDSGRLLVVQDLTTEAVPVVHVFRRVPQ